MKKSTMNCTTLLNILNDDSEGKKPNSKMQEDLHEIQ